MTAFARVPPGRAGRQWLRRRLDVAEGGLALLQRKSHILMREHRHLAAEADSASREWAAKCRDADTLALRAALTDGRRSLRPTSPAYVTVRWRDIMGIRCPAEATCDLPDSPSSLPSSAALVQAREAARVALAAALRHAVAHEAERRVAQEINATRQRIRALQDRWIPRLTEALRAIDLALDDMERANAARLVRSGVPDAGPSGDRAGTEGPGSAHL